MRPSNSLSVAAKGHANEVSVRACTCKYTRDTYRRERERERERKREGGKCTTRFLFLLRLVQWRSAAAGRRRKEAEGGTEGGRKRGKEILPGDER